MGMRMRRNKEGLWRSCPKEKSNPRRMEMKWLIETDHPLLKKKMKTSLSLPMMVKAKNLSFEFNLKPKVKNHLLKIKYHPQGETIKLKPHLKQTLQDLAQGNKQILKLKSKKVQIWKGHHHL